MKNQALFSSKDKSKKLKCRLLKFLSGALRVKKQMTLLVNVSLKSLMLIPDTCLYFCCKNVKSFCSAKAYFIFSAKKYQCIWL